MKKTILFTMMLLSAVISKAQCPAPNVQGQPKKSNSDDSFTITLKDQNNLSHQYVVLWKSTSDVNWINSGNAGVVYHYTQSGGTTNVTMLNPAFLSSDNTTLLRPKDGDLVKVARDCNGTLSDFTQEYTVHYR